MGDVLCFALPSSQETTEKRPLLGVFNQLTERDVKTLQTLLPKNILLAVNCIVALVTAFDELDGEDVNS